MAKIPKCCRFDPYLMLRREKISQFLGDSCAYHVICNFRTI